MKNKKKTHSNFCHLHYLLRACCFLTVPVIFDYNNKQIFIFFSHSILFMSNVPTSKKTKQELTLLFRLILIKKDAPKRKKNFFFMTATRGLQQGSFSLRHLSWVPRGVFLNKRQGKFFVRIIRSPQRDIISWKSLASMTCTRQGLGRQRSGTKNSCLQQIWLYELKEKRVPFEITCQFLDGSNWANLQQV